MIDFILTAGYPLMFLSGAYWGWYFGWIRVQRKWTVRFDQHETVWLFPQSRHKIFKTSHNVTRKDRDGKKTEYQFHTN